MNNAVTEMLGCRYPTMLGAMGVICNPELVAAVSEAGGYGLLATAFVQDVDVLRTQVRQTKELTDQPFGANIFAMNPLVPDLIDILAEEGVKAVTVSGGSPKAIIPMLHDKNIKALVVVPTADVAQKAAEVGADAIVAEGSESGGMQGFKGASTFVLVPAVCDRVKIPVIAAGGIGDSRGYKASFALGAQGVQVGTRFIATKECIAHDNYKTTILNAKETGTGLVELGKIRIRALQTELVESMLQGLEDTSKAFSGPSIEASWLQGDIGVGVLPAGEVSGLVKGIPSVKELVNEMISG
jgi:NAD(P)H-dependent flavin oxidoreductase YrpB (nitropropane dioxygenase family)